MTATTTYAVLPTAALEEAHRLRQEGATFPAILRTLTVLGWNTSDYDTQLLRRHVQRYAATLPVAARRFGVEIEVFLPPATAAAALRAAGLQAEVESYNHQTRTHWKVTTDATVPGGAEVVSPPLSDWADVATAMTALREAGGRVDRRTGLHVHHEVADLDGFALARLVRMYADHAAELDGLVAPSRRVGRNGMCNRPSPRQVGILTSVLEGVTGTTLAQRQASARGVRNVDRYLTLNLHSYVRYGTVEFRQHQGTLSGAKAEAWLLLGQAMIRAAVEGRTFPTGGLVSGLADAGCLAAEPAEFLHRRAATLATA